MMNKEAELYIHIPFCVRKCNYCDFLSFSVNSEVKKAYVNALLKEIASASYQLKNHTVRSVFFGGGTPSVLEAENICSILNMLCRCFSISKEAEITLECNPGTADFEKLKALRNAGFNRLSMGAQSFDDNMLKTIGRIHDSKTIYSCFNDAVKAGFENINIDLISALPGETKEKWFNDLNAAASLEPTHISAYSLILEEGTPLFDRQNEFEFPDEDAEREMYYGTGEILSSFGYHQYEISNYAKMDFECIHNIGYWMGVPYLGLGLGASSYIGNKRFKVTPNMEQYLKSSIKADSLYEDLEELGESDLMAEFMILGLRMTCGINKIEFNRRFNCTVESVYSDIIEKYKRLGMLECGDDYIRFTKVGISVSNVILADFV